MRINVRPAAPLHVFKTLVSHPCHQFLFSFLLLGRQFFARRRDGPLFRRGPLEDAGAGAGHGHACFALPGLLCVGSLSRQNSWTACLRPSGGRPRGRCLSLESSRGARGPAPPQKAGQLLTPRTVRHAAETPARDSRDACCPVSDDRSFIRGARAKIISWTSKPRRL